MNGSSPSRYGHVVALAIPFWGHTKPLCALLARIVKVRPIYVTFFTEASVLEKVHDELSRQFLPEENELQKMIRVITLPPPQVLFQFGPFQTAFLDQYQALYECQPTPVSSNSEVIYEAVPRPQLIILDFFCYEALTGIRSISGSTVPVYAWQTGAVPAMIYHFGPESMGGGGDLAEKISTIESYDNEERDKEIERIYCRLDGKVVEMPGIPPMYDYEYFPQISALPVKLSAVVMMFKNSYRFFSSCDGVIHFSSRIFEEEALKKFQEWFEARPVLAVGPLSPPADASDIEREKAKSPIAGEVELFLSDAFKRFGAYSVFYISFGTILWPAEAEKVWLVINILLEQGIPFILSHASPIAAIPEEMKKKVRETGLGFMAPWLPQQVILQHKACGWILSHCGHNSVMESLTAGVPFICWPYGGDQPVNAANIAVHNAGYELFEVRNGDGLRPIHRLGDRIPNGTMDEVRREVIEVVSKARGEDGRSKRSNAQQISEKMAQSWEHGGLAWTELNKIVDLLD